MTTTELRLLLEQLELRPSRRLGQNFLVDSNLLAALVREAAPTRAETILEIGPGTGVMTAELLKLAGQVIAVELDYRLAAYLQQTYAGEPRLRVVQADACTVDYDQLLGDTPYRCIANLPYAASTPAIARLLHAANAPSQLYVLLQLEMAQRLAATPASKSYGALSVRIQHQYAVTLVRRVPPSVFYPPPEVDSAFVRLTAHTPRPTPAQREQLEKVVRLGFSQRRKRLAKPLQSQFAPASVAAAFAELSLDDNVRAEHLSVAEFAELTQLLHS